MRPVRANGSWTPDSRIALTSEAPANFGDTWEQMARISWKNFRPYIGMAGNPIALIFFTFGLSLLGAFEITLPSGP